MNKLVTACMIARNCADTIEATLNYLDKSFEKVVIIYDESVDDTTELLMKYKDKFNIYYNKFENFSQQWSFCLEKARITNDYLLKIDSDEIYSTEDFDKVAMLMSTAKIKAIYFPRYNLQNDFNHYKKSGYPDYQIRLVHNSAIMDGKPVDESILVNGKRMQYNGIKIIHFGHVRNNQALIQKSIDRKVFADVDKCDGEYMKKYEYWFLERNELWKNDINILPSDIQEIVNLYKQYLR